ncbi:MAG: ribosome small subunit-dependent GTPase A [Clostridia bacterium]|nr:ribosome small subunit-dependent GTPase A [Clostridia bacterium]
MPDRDPHRRVPCRPRGRLRRTGVKVGDRVAFRPLPRGEGAIEAVLPRRNELARPPVANVERVVVVMAWREPDFQPELLDRILVQAHAAGIRAVVVVTKLDLARDALDRAAAEAARAVYEGAGYEAHLVSAMTGEGLAPLAARLREPGVQVLAGPSGSGKSFLLSRVEPGLSLRSGEVSRRTGRGRHTTVHARLLPIGAGWVADTPGFSRVALPAMASGELGAAFPELAVRAAGCRFRDCLHRKEPGCAVREAVARGEVDRGRYERYVQFLAELEARRRWR